MHTHAYSYTPTKTYANTYTRQTGRITTDQHTRWKYADPKTLLELLSKGSLTLAQVRAILKDKRLTVAQVRKAVRKMVKAVDTWQEQIAIMRAYYSIINPNSRV